MMYELIYCGENSRMVKKMKNEDQTAILVSNFTLPLEDPGLSFIIALPNIGTELDVLLEGIDREIEKVQQDLITEQEYQKLQNKFESDFIQDNTSMLSIAESLANYHTYYGDAHLINTTIET